MIFWTLFLFLFIFTPSCLISSIVTISPQTRCLNGTLVFALTKEHRTYLQEHVELTSDPHYRETFGQHMLKHEVDALITPILDRIQKILSVFPQKTIRRYHLTSHHMDVCASLETWKYVLGDDLNVMPVPWQGEILHVMGLAAMKQEQQLVKHSLVQSSPKSVPDPADTGGNYYYSTPPNLLVTYYGLEASTIVSPSKIAVVEYDDQNGLPISINPNDAQPYVNLTTPNNNNQSPKIIQPPTISGPNNPKNVQSIEGSLDVDAILGWNTDSSVYYLQSSMSGFYGSLFTIYTLGIDVVEVVSISYGTIENYGNFCGTDCITDPTLNNNNYLLRFDNLLLMMASIGQTVIASAGDFGANGAGTCSGTGVLDVNFPASSPLVLSVGATSIQFQHYTVGTSNPNAEYCSLTAPAMGPYSVNPDLPQFSGFACYYTNTGDNLVEESVSIQNDGYTSGSGVSTYYPMPSYQKWNNIIDTYLYDYSHADVNFPQINVNFNASNRFYPDVSIFGGTTYLVNNNSQLSLVGGTSLSSPLMASVVAALNNVSRTYNNNQTIGFVNPLLYYMSLQPDYNNLFYDITIGTNNCPYTVQGCTATNNMCFGFDAQPGFDLTSGLGTPKVQAMITSLTNYFQSNGTLSSTAGSSYQSSIAYQSSASPSTSTGTSNTSSSSSMSVFVIVIIAVVLGVVILMIGLAIYYYVYLPMSNSTPRRRSSRSISRPTTRSTSRY